MNTKFILSRLIQLLITLLGITFITFSLVYLAPGDPVRTMYISSGNIPSEAIIEQTREAMGLNQPFGVQYANWLANIFRGDFGISFSLNQPVIDIAIPRIFKTINLALAALAMMLAISLPLGILSAIKANKPFDYAVRAYTSLGISMPGFLIGTLLLYFVGLKLHLLPIVSTANNIQALILPAMTLAIPMSAKYIRQIRSVLLDELEKEYVIAAVSRGIPFSAIVIKDILPNILLPLITLLGISLGSLLSGVAVVEVIFSYPGIGSLAVDAIIAYDYNLIQAYVLLISVIYMSINLLVDISYSYLDPRNKLERG
ncbi:ABC transporter permease [Candidatus Epulonipiscium viviparus]|uniref:ABC transporter permease n=1 Tax=Candidatus Epulonipiscium viviparus TaxID=420336 RepID=UPI00016C009F|nr:ABC transporter permease [Candidatus Epulopiscium viviparus]